MILIACDVSFGFFLLLFIFVVIRHIARMYSVHYWRVPLLRIKCFVYPDENKDGRHKCIVPRGSAPAALASSGRNSQCSTTWYLHDR